MARVSSGEGVSWESTWMAQPSRPNRDPRERIAALYRWYAEVEAAGRSELFGQMAMAVAADPATLDFLAALPRPKWQPNLLLGAVRYLFGTPPDAAGFLDLVRTHPDEIAAVMAVRRTQTNEPARCATLLPALARLPQPLALLEVGASAGLCLLPDRYAYAYGDHRVAPSPPGNPTAPVFSCVADALTPLPVGNLEVVWRAGLDLHPVDLTDPAEIRWLEALVWPGQEHRLAGLRAACDVARADPPRIVAGDLRADLAALAAQAPAGATLVVFHTAVLGYVTDPAERAAFADTVGELEAVWIANERARVIPAVGEDVAAQAPTPAAFLMCVDGEPTAWTDPHGASIVWRAER